MEICPLCNQPILKIDAIEVIETIVVHFYCIMGFHLEHKRMPKVRELQRLKLETSKPKGGIS
jgi:hypothetical protein